MRPPGWTRWRLACAARGTAGPTSRAPGTTTTWSSGSTACRSSTWSIRTNRCAGARRSRRTGTRWFSTARSTTTSSCGRCFAPNMVRSSARTATVRPSSRRSTTGARLRGMFAFLIWDTRDRVLFGARDPFGIKPLFVAQLPDGVAFSSEAKGLRELTGPARVNVPALQHYLVLQYVPEPATMDPNIRKIESGTHVTVRPGRPLKTKRYFHPVFASRPAISDAERSALYQRIAAVMDDSVAKHMRADVTVGAFLSGGID